MDENSTKIPMVVLILVTLMLIGFVAMSIIISNILTLG